MATESDKLNVGAIGTLVAVLALAMVAIVAVLTAMVRNEIDREVERKGGTANDKEYRSLAAAQNAELTEDATWVDKNAGVLSIPIERSMHLVVEDLRRDPSLATAEPADAGTPDAETDEIGDAEPDADETKDAAATEERPSAPQKSPSSSGSTAPPSPPPSPTESAVPSPPTTPPQTDAP